ncbi:MAG: CDP-glycerol glycerophosphotransferase family protein [Clostridium sp.]|nr:CDP-glycerol glycerophosphotransferase family protein [Clostridium sp.]MDU7085274.1 CDP-glycerol glycerophosphotransferase family protein [Clostridium sp.]
MDIIAKIQVLLESNNIEAAYNLIMDNEELLINNSDYWNLRGMLCSKIGEYETAAGCYKTSIEINERYLDGYFNLIFTYKLLGEKLKSIMYGGVALRHTSDLNFINDIKGLYEDDYFASKVYEILELVKKDNNIKVNGSGLINYISSKFNNIDNSYIEILASEEMTKYWAYVEKDVVVTSREIQSIDEFILKNESTQYNIIVPYDVNYIEVIRGLAKKGINGCYIIIPSNHKFDLIEIDNNIMTALKNEDYKRTITLNKFNAADSNVFAMTKYVPEKYENKYKLNVIKGRDVYSVENIVKVPLISQVTISGFNTFVSYPKFTYNIDVGHASIIMKNCGIMDKKNKGFAFTPKEYEKIDKVCIASHMNMLIQSSFSSIPENKYEITGNPRTDTLMLSNGKKNLEKILGKKIDGKKIIFNMPTFHIHENSGVVNGEKFNDGIKIKDFNYVKFNEFLGKNNLLCISKVHHAEERMITEKAKERKLENLIFISNKNLEDNDLDLYEILNSGDLLLTDYSSIYGDFLFMNKPTVFINTDIDKYREERGLSLEPYDYWTAGPKVQNQQSLELEILKSLNDEEYYKTKREELRYVFNKYIDSNSSLRVWEHIDRVLNSLEDKNI